jgi:membrane fusion protein (multidrug efflux system)
MTKTRRWVVLAAAAGVAALGGVAYYFNRAGIAAGSSAGATAAPAAGKAATAGGPPGAVGVEAVKVRLDTLTDDVAAVGTLLANESVVLRPEIAGRIERIAFREGAAVAKGALLVALDDSTQAADLQQAQANLALAESNFRRSEDLFHRKFVSASALDQSAATLKVAQAAAAQAAARRAKTRIVAPFTGVIGIRNVSPGDYVKEGQDLVTLQDISSLKVDFKLPEQYLGRLGKGQRVELETDTRRGETFAATVDALDPLIDSNGRAIALRARLANPDARLRPGMFVRVRLIFGQRKGVAMVPEEALVPAGADQYVFRIRDGKAQRVKVSTGVRRNAQVEIAAGLQADDTVVTAGQLKLREGVAVSLVPAGGGAANAPAAQTR